MELVFASGGVADMCRVASNRKRIWSGNAHAIGRRLAEFAAVGTLADASMLPGLTMVAEEDDGHWRLICAHGVEFRIRAWPSVDRDKSEPDLNQVTGIMIDAVNIVSTS